MKGKVIKLLIIMGVIAATSTTSFYVGKQMENRRILTGKQEIATKEESTKIAIVNQDLGTDYNDKNVNYALQFLNSVDDGYEITNREAAKNGIEDGKYGAMVVIPGNFSKNITTINDVTPSKVKIYYETNNNLNDENKLIVSSKISEFEKKLNNKLSYIYVSSVFDEVHKGQDYASDILKNDEIDTDAINSINDSDILESINLTTLEDEDLKFNDINLSNDFDNNKQVISEVDSKYRNLMTTKETNLNNVKKELEDVVGNGETGIQSFSRRLKSMNQQDLRKQFADRHVYNYDGLSTNYKINVNDVSSYLDSLTKENGKIDDLANSYEKELSEINKKGQNAIKKSTDNLNDVQEKTSSDADIIKNNSIRSLNDLKDSIKNRNQNDPKMQALNQEYLLYAQMINKLKETNPAAFDSVYNEVVNDSKVDYSKILKDPSEKAGGNNSFANWNELKQYIKNQTNDQSENSILSRSNKYEEFDKNDEKSNENISSIDSTIDDLNKVKDDLDKMSSSSSDILRDSDYKDINSIFNEDTDTPLYQKLKIKSNFIDKLKDEIGGTNKKQLVSSMESNNKENVDSIKGKVEKEVEQVVEGDGPIDVGDVIKVFEKNYMSRFKNVITHVSNLDKTPSKIDEDKEILDLLTQYDKSNEVINNKVDKQLDEYDKMVDKIQEQADKHVDTLQDDLDKGIQASQDKLSQGLEGAKKTKTNTSNSNHEKLDSLTNVLANSRVGTVENTDMYNFMINPVSAVQNKELEGNIVKKPNNEDNIKKAALSFSTIYLLGLGFVGIRIRKKNK